MENNLMNEWIENWEGQMTEWMDSMVKSEQFMKNFMQTYEPVMDNAKNLNQMRQKFYETFGLVSREDVALMTQKIQNLEIKLADVIEKFEDSENDKKEIIESLNTIKSYFEKEKKKSKSKK
ncbi:MAG: hypothetical protein ACQESP_02595 [Candidatus Muiribacteriota bacterium]